MASPIARAGRSGTVGLSRLRRFLYGSRRWLGVTTACACCRLLGAMADRGLAERAGGGAALSRPGGGGRGRRVPRPVRARHHVRHRRRRAARLSLWRSPGSAGRRKAATTWPQAKLGLMYLVGWAVPRDPAEAARWYRKAADQGNVIAEARLARLYADGIGVPRSLVEPAVGASGGPPGRQDGGVACRALRGAHDAGRDRGKPSAGSGRGGRCAKRRGAPKARLGKRVTIRRCRCARRRAGGREW